METTKLTCSLKYRSTATFIAKYGAPFPLDMLRYDACHPATSEDAAAIARSHDPGIQETSPVTVVRYHDTKDPRWTAARWESFGWRLMDGRCSVVIARKRGAQ